MKPVLLIDFGSTYTKVTAVDVDAPRLLGVASAYTTVETDINDGLSEALRRLEAAVGKLEFSERYAASSAAGGLRMMASGLVPELTAEAARLASLGAGAKVVKTYAFELTEDDVREIVAENPDIFLLVGGTDGGNKQCIINNARMLAAAGGSFPIIIAGNRNAARECERILAGRDTHICENVLPKFGVLNIAPTQQQIRDTFLKNIIRAKGLSRASELVSGILMPTPSAVIRAVELLANGTYTEAGIGELLAVDVGGATTDVYSAAHGNPRRPNTVIRGLAEPFIKRTVEGDIGMRYSVKGIVDAAGIDEVARRSGLTVERAQELVSYLSEHTDALPSDDELERLDEALAGLAVKTAVARHAGRIEETYTMFGLSFVQSGKDLTGVTNLVVTGGSLVHTRHTARIAACALYDAQEPDSLRPEHAKILVDRKYIISAMGLLSGCYPDAALTIMKEELEQDGIGE
ncbi:MAG: methylaspartate mutase accessory protein GlmL [Clostridia bacterium]|nr:methylaspartate mutase accessory protein GlmL [Clostridia bacterium]